MSCKYFLVRTKKGKKYFYCKCKKIIINCQFCQKCTQKEYKIYKKMNKKSKTLAKIEKKRFSILTNDLEHCYTCKKLYEIEVKKDDIHEIFKGRNRIRSIKNGFCVPLCWKCHKRTEDDIEFLRKLQKECQIEYMKTHSKQEFLNIIDKSYIK